MQQKPNNRHQPPFLPDREEVKARMKMVDVMKDNGFGVALMESVMVWDTPPFAVVQEYLEKYPPAEARELLNELIHKNTRRKLTKNKRAIRVAPAAVIQRLLDWEE